MHTLKYYCKLVRPIVTRIDYFAQKLQLLAHHMEVQAEECEEKEMKHRNYLNEGNVGY